MSKKQKKCQTCGKKEHDYEHELEKFWDCVPPKDILKFGEYEINKEYRDELYEKYPFYTTEEVVGSYLGHNPYFPSQEDYWSLKDSEEEDEDDI